MESSYPRRANLALVVAKADKVNIGYTALTLDMAYNNARLVARPGAAADRGVLPVAAPGGIA